MNFLSLRLQETIRGAAECETVAHRWAGLLGRTTSIAGKKLALLMDTQNVYSRAICITQRCK
jgi:hypothetical protein